jgi:hypothetical protein
MPFGERPEDLLERSTGAVVHQPPDGESEVVGTGFVVSPTGHVLTAGHLVVKVPADELRFRLADGTEHGLVVLDSKFDEPSGTDYALCTVNAPCRAFLPLSFARGPRGTARSRGYGQTTGAATPSTGDLIGSLDFGGIPANRVFLYISQQAGDPGFSGSAVYSKEAGGAVALQTEASIRGTGPHRDTVLAYPLFHLKGLLSRHVDLWTRLTWYARSLLASAAARPWRLLTAVGIIAAIGLGGYVTYRTLATYDRLAIFGREGYLVMEAQESAFWVSPAALEFNAGVRDEQIDLATAMPSLLRNHDMSSLVISLDSLYESIARCTNEDVCLEQPVCPVMYGVLWDFYSRYWPFLDEYYAALGRDTSPQTRRFLRTRCASERGAHCDEVDNEPDVCLTAPLPT